MIGTGGEITDTGYGDTSGGDGQVSITDILPSADLASVTVTAGIRDPLNWDAAVDTFSVTAQARCARTLVIPVVTGLERVSASASNNGTNDPHKMAIALCTPGKRLLTTGFQLNRANGKAFVNRVSPTGFYDGAEVDAYADVLNYTGQVAEGDLHAPAPWTGVWDLKAFAVCANPRPALATAEAEASGGESGSTTQSCPAGTILTTTFVDLQTDLQRTYGLSPIALEQVSLNPTKSNPRTPTIQSSTVRLSLDQLWTWVGYITAYCV